MDVSGNSFTHRTQVATVMQTIGAVAIAGGLTIMLSFIAARIPLHTHPTNILSRFRFAAFGMFGGGVILFLAGVMLDRGERVPVQIQSNCRRVN